MTVGKGETFVAPSFQNCNSVRGVFESLAFVYNRMLLEAP